jgi:hypothetical protein
VFLETWSPLDQLPPGSKGPVFQPLPAVQRRQTLFLDLAGTAPTPEGMAQFRQRFGDRPAGGAVVDADTGHVLSRIVGCNPSLPGDEELRQEILALRQCVRLWELVRDDQIDALKRYIRWQPDPEGGYSVVYNAGADVPPDQPAPSPVVIASASVYPELRRQMNPDDLVTPAVVFLQRLVNERLDRMMTSRLLGKPQERELGLYSVPKDVVGSIWLQFAEAVAGKKEFERCEVCRTWIEKSGRGRSRKDQERKGRSDRLYCSPRCKQEAYRQRKERVLRLHAEGKKPREIAQEVGTTAETAKGWIAQQRKKEKGDSQKMKGPATK